MEIGDGRLEHICEICWSDIEKYLLVSIVLPMLEIDVTAVTDVTMCVSANTYLSTSITRPSILQ